MIINPTIDFLDVKCPCYNSEWFQCNITKSHCPTRIDDETTTFPVNCPAKDKIIIEINKKGL